MTILLIVYSLIVTHGKCFHNVNCNHTTNTFKIIVTCFKNIYNFSILHNVMIKQNNDKPRINE